MNAEIIVGRDGKSSCHWCGAAQELLSNHDTEWGFPVGDDQGANDRLWPN